MDKNMARLIKAAKSVRRQFPLAYGFSAGSVGAAILTDKGNIYTGICIDLACGLGFCAEASAMSEMLKNKETHITSIVAVSKDRILPPCGRCREMMVQIDVRNFECQVIVGESHTVTLRELLPNHWLNQST